MDSTKRGELKRELAHYLSIKDKSPELPFIMMDAHLVTLEEVLDVMKEMGFGKFRHDV